MRAAPKKTKRKGQLLLSHGDRDSKYIMDYFRFTLGVYDNQQRSWTQGPNVIWKYLSYTPSGYKIRSVEMELKHALALGIIKPAKRFEAILPMLRENNDWADFIDS